MLRFGIVGASGVIVDSAVLLAILAMGGSLYSGRIISYLVAASTNWALNRVWTFQGRNAGAAHVQWMRFILVNLIGFAVNYGTYVALLKCVPLVTAFPVLGVAAGALTGMLGNFLLSRRFVYRREQAVNALTSIYS